VLVAREFGLSPELIRQIELGGNVHDIGKIGVREEVLNKTGPLTPEEYDHIMTHPVIGWRILAPLLGDAPRALNIVRWHHERFDGKGLPDRLSGQGIPLEARIVAVADTLDAITSDRPYRASEKTLSMAVDELRRNSGSQFDPDVIDAIVKCTERGELRLIPKAAG
jgi:HD-GYP domain-containing protein (c-di-GMP phosphodiesterase class II)